MMTRREFLKVSAGGLGACACFSLWGCGTNGSDSSSGVPPPVTEYVANDRMLAYDSSGNSYEILSDQGTIVRLNPDGSTLWVAGGHGTAEGQLNAPVSLLADTENTLYVMDYGNSRISVFDSNGTYLRQIGSFGDGDDQMRFPCDMVIGPDGLLYVSDSLNHRIQVFDLTGNPVHRFSSLGTGDGELNYPESLAFDPAGYLHVIDSGNWRVQVFTASGQYRGQYGSRGKDIGQFLNPEAITIDTNGYSYIADNVTEYVTTFDPDWRPLTRFQPLMGDGRLLVPCEIIWLPDGRLYVGGFPDMAHT
jgi:DNA-binding beta-propeller fold protein YncE